MANGEFDTKYAEWPHAPSHLFSPHAMYFVTAGTYRKQHLFNTASKRDCLLQTLFEQAQRLNWRLEAWAIMANHYHFVACASDDPESLRPMITSLHSKMAIWLNREDGTSGRKVWYQYRDTCLTYQRSYLARLNYVHNNPVKHGLVKSAEEYPWCSMAWFLAGAEPKFRALVRSVKHDRINVDDEY